MMTLVVDVGNSRIKWGFVRDGDVGNQGIIAYSHDAVDAALDEAWGKLSAPPSRLLVSNVGGDAVAQGLSEWVERHWSITAEYATSRAQGWGVTNAYPEPEVLGSDRWAVLVGARHRYSGPVCIVDCGTALTADVLSAGGEHLGGMIAPGIGLMYEMLTQRAPGLKNAVGGEVTGLARNTPDAVTAGVLYAASGLVERVMSELEQRFGDTVHCVVTGGDGERLRQYLQRRCILEPNLVLIGLAAMAGRTP